MTGACGNDGGGTPTGPTPPAAPLIPEGPALLDVSSVDLSCSAKTPAWGFFGPRAGAAATIVREGDGWVARGGVPAAGDFELRFRPGGGTTIGAQVVGELRGTAIDLISSLTFPNPNQATVSGAAADQPASITGVALGQLGLVGDVSGTIVYTDNQGGVMRCTSARWTLFAVSR